jgi:RimJ/RimL family protein N-acetyltransferase
MPNQPTLETARLRLRPFRMADADDVQRLAGDPAVADTTLKIPHPYEDGMAEKWISNHRDWFDRREQAVFAVTLKLSRATAASELIGAIGLRIEPDDQRAELGYWISKSFWGQGYCTEAARAVLDFGFEQLGLNRIVAHHFGRNPSSGRVMQKIGMSLEGRLRQHARKGDAFEDLELYGILRSEWQR